MAECDVEGKHPVPLNVVAVCSTCKLNGSSEKRTLAVVLNMPTSWEGLYRTCIISSRYPNSVGEFLYLSRKEMCVIAKSLEDYKDEEIENL